MARPTSPSVAVSVSRRGYPGGDPDRTVVWLGGEHDVATRASVAATIARAARRDNAPLVVDLSAVTFMDASTIGAIIENRNLMLARGLSLRLRDPSTSALRVLDLCGLAHLVHVDPARPFRVAAALASWIDVSPIERIAQVDNDPARKMSRSRKWQLARVLATSGGLTDVPGATTEADRTGP